MLVMVQREVGERLAAGPGSKAYGAVSVKVAYHATARVVGRVPSSVFVPRPAVDSVLVRIERLPVVAVDPSVVAAARLFELVRAGFGHRRKMLRQSLAGVVPAEAFTAAAIDPEARAENLGVEDWGRLAAWPPTPTRFVNGVEDDGLSVSCPRQAHVVVARDGGARRRLPPARRRDGVDRPRRHTHLRPRDRDFGGGRRPG